MLLHTLLLVGGKLACRQLVVLVLVAVPAVAAACTLLVEMTPLVADCVVVVAAVVGFAVAERRLAVGCTPQLPLRWQLAVGGGRTLLVQQQHRQQQLVSDERGQAPSSPLPRLLQRGLQCVADDDAGGLLSHLQSEAESLILECQVGFGQPDEVTWPVTYYRCPVCGHCYPAGPGTCLLQGPTLIITLEVRAPCLMPQDLALKRYLRWRQCPVTR